MTLSKQCLVLTTESLIGEQSLLSKKLWLNNSLILSRMKIFYYSRYQSKKGTLNFDIYKYINIISNNKKIYTLLVSEILYLLNFKKKFSQKNSNRITENYFKIFSSSTKKKINLAIIPKQIIKDQNYLTTLALCSLYTISRFYYGEESI